MSDQSEWGHGSSEASHDWVGGFDSFKKAYEDAKLERDQSQPYVVGKIRRPKISEFIDFDSESLFERLTDCDDLPEETSELIWSRILSVKADGGEALNDLTKSLKGLFDQWWLHHGVSLEVFVIEESVHWTPGKEYD